VHVSAAYAQPSVQRAAILLYLLCVPLSSRRYAVMLGLAFSPHAGPAARARTSMRLIGFLFSARLSLPANALAKLRASLNGLSPNPAAPAFVFVYSNGRPLVVPISLQRAALSIAQWRLPVAAISLRAYLRARGAFLRAQILPLASTPIFLLSCRVPLFPWFLFPAWFFTSCRADLLRDVPARGRYAARPMS
jgi:hypothetical protein